MRKATVEIVLHPHIKDLYGDFFEKVEYAEALQSLRLDFDKGIKIGIVRYRLKKEYALEDLPTPPGVEILDVLKVEGKDYICLGKGTVMDKYRSMMKEFDLDVFWDRPTYATSEKMVCSVIGDQPNLKKFIEKIRLLGEITSISCHRDVYQPYNILSCLTNRQMSVLVEAKKSGYYDYPRRINADGLAERLGIGKSAAIEHLRKAEGRIISQILSGY